MKNGLLAILLFANGLSFAQKNENPNPDPIRKWYGMSGYEFIFSFGNVQSAGLDAENVVRFTPFFNPQAQRHYNFSNGIGIYTGIGMRNVGFINHFELANEEEVILKQRCYTFGIPLAIKTGGLERGNYLAMGIEAEIMVHYKEKIMQGDHSLKATDWFSSDVNQFNPSLFADIRFHNGTFFRFRYYLNDFLKEKDMSFVLPVSGNKVDFVPTKSTLFYVSIGTAFKLRTKKKMSKKDA